MTGENGENEIGASPTITPLKKTGEKKLRKVKDLLKLEEIEANDDNEEQSASIGRVAFAKDF